MLRAGDFTVYARAQVINVTGVGSYYSGFVSIAPTAESEQVTNDIFVPMITQLFGGGSDPPECGDADSTVSASSPTTIASGRPETKATFGLRLSPALPIASSQSTERSAGPDAEGGTEQGRTAHPVTAREGVVKAAYHPYLTEELGADGFPRCASARVGTDHS